MAARISVVLIKKVVKTSTGDNGGNRVRTLFSPLPHVKLFDHLMDERCISARARSDLDRIFAYIYVRQGPKAADRFLEIARQAARCLAQRPPAGPHPSWATRHQAVRFWVNSRTNFLIYYLPEEQGVSIERVLDGRRDVARIMELGLEDPPDREP